MASRVPFLNLSAPHTALRDEILAALAEIVDSGRFILADNVTAFEKEFAAFCGSPNAIAVGSGTDTLVLALEALDVGTGDEVIVPAWTFAASAAAVCHVGAKPVFVDCAPDTFLMDIEKTISLITSKTKAIMPVHLYGEMVDLDRLMSIAREQQIAVVEDAAQSGGASHNGKSAGSIGDAGCFSFYPTKTLGSCGEGGLTTTPHAEVALKIRHLRNQADDTTIGGKKYSHSAVGYNSRLQEMQAAILRIKLRHLDEWNTCRRKAAAAYNALLSDAPVQLPKLYADASHIYGSYTIRTQRRDELSAWLNEQGIGNMTYYPIPLHLQPAYASLKYKEGDLPVAERNAREVLSLPIFPEITTGQIEQVAEAVKEFCTK